MTNEPLSRYQQEAISADKMTNTMDMMKETPHRSPTPGSHFAEKKCLMDNRRNTVCYAIDQNIHSHFYIYAYLCMYIISVH